MKTVKITPPEGYEIDKENSTFDEIVFKMKDEWVDTWEELGGISGWYVRGDSEISIADGPTKEENKNVFPERVQAEAVVALAQLLQLRQRVIGIWRPDWTTSTSKWCVYFVKDSVRVSNNESVNRILSFPTREIVKKFLDKYRDLIETAKPLL